MAIWALIGLIGLISLIAISGYNSLLALRKQVQNAWSQIDVQLKRRCDLIPNLVETAKGTMKHEREVLEEVSRARQQAIEARGVYEQAEAENQLTQTLCNLFAVAEAYPEKASHDMLTLLEELTTTEQKIAAARQSYNDQVMALNHRVHQFPWNLIANAGGFRPAEYFIVDEPDPRETPTVAS